MLRRLYNNQFFFTNLLSVFLNPFYFGRKGIYKYMKENTETLTGTLVDFGCGKKPYEKLFSKAEKYIGVDIDDRGHSHKNEHIDVYYDGDSIPLEDNYADSMLSSEVFEHVDNLDEIVKELKRILKPNGCLLVTVPFVFFEHEMPYDFRRLSLNGLELLLKNHNFEIVNKHKSTSDIETIIQIVGFQFFLIIERVPKILRILLTFLFIAPINIIGVILNLVLPNRKKFYLNSIILAKNIK